MSKGLLPKESQASETRKKIILKLLETDSISPSRIFTPEERQKAFYHLKTLENDGWVKNVGGKYSLADRTDEFIEIAKRMCEITKSDEEKLRGDEEFKKALKKLISYSLIVLGKLKMEDLTKLALIPSRAIDDTIKICERGDERRGINSRREVIENSVISSVSEIGSNVMSREELELLNALTEVSRICKRYFRRLKGFALEKKMVSLLRNSYRYEPSPNALEKNLESLLGIISKEVPEEYLRLFEKAYKGYIKKSINI